jgi:hypothetical protein
MPVFSVRIRKIWMQRCVDVPPAALKALGAPPIPVIARYAGTVSETTVTAGGRGRGRMVLLRDALRAAGLDTGDRIEVEVAVDTASREPAVPADFQNALLYRPAAAAEFRRRTPAFRRQMMRHLENARRPETRQNRIEQMVERLAELGARSRR